jgi:hypothetical protein
MEQTTVIGARIEVAPAHESAPATSAGSGGVPLLMRMVELIAWEVHGSDFAHLNKTMPLKILLERSCEQLGVDPSGLAFYHQARQCYQKLVGTSSNTMPTASTPPVASRWQCELDSSPVERIEDIPSLNLSTAERTTLWTDETSGPSLTERSDRTPSDREPPPKALCSSTSLVIDLRRHRTMHLTSVVGKLTAEGNGQDSSICC